MINTIFLVEDETLFILKIQDIMEMLDFDVDVTEATTSEEALDILENKKSDSIDCFFLDLNLKGSEYNGLELGKKIRGEYENAVIMMVSTSTDSIEIEAAKECGFNGWIVKSGDLSSRLEEFKKDFKGYVEGILDFKLYE